MLAKRLIGMIVHLSVKGKAIPVKEKAYPLRLATDVDLYHFNCPLGQISDQMFTHAEKLLAEYPLGREYRLAWCLLFLALLLAPR